MEREAERHFNGGLTLKDDTIRDRCQEIARLLTTSIGSLMCDGDTSKSLERHSSLVDALVDHIDASIGNVICPPSVSNNRQFGH